MKRTIKLCLECVAISSFLFLAIIGSNRIVSFAQSWSEHTQNTILKNVLTSNGILREDFSFKDKHTVDLVKQYAVAWVDYMVASEEIKPVNASVFTGLYTMIPNGVKVTAMRFDDEKLCVVCETENADLYEHMQTVSDHSVWISPLSGTGNVYEFSFEISF